MDGEGGRDHVSGVGSLLRACRLRAGVTLVDAAEFLNIRRSYLQAIEDERYGDLPGPPYAVGFVRGYAEYLGLDGHEITRRFRAEMAGSTSAAARAGKGWRKPRGSEGKRAQDLRFPLAASETATPSGSVLLVGAMFALLVYGGWYALTASDALVPDLVAPLPERLAGFLPDTDLSRDNPPPEKQVADPGGQPIESDAQRLHTGDGQPPLSVAHAATAGAMPARAPEMSPLDVEGTDSTDGTLADGIDSGLADAGRASPPAAEPPATESSAADRSVGDPVIAEDRPRVSLEALAESWVEIRDRDNKRILSRLLAPGDVVDVPDQAGLRLTVGNAGGLVIRIDGAPVPPLGGSGVVLRDVPLESASLQQAVISAN